MKVAFDFDDCLIDFVACFLAAVNDFTDRSYTREDIDLEGWDMGPWCNRILGLGSDEPLAWLEWLRHRLRFWEEAETMPGVLEALDQLAASGHELELLTNKPRWAHTVVWHWLDRTDAPFTTVRILDGFAKELASDAVVLVDDRPDTVRAWNASAPWRTGILFARSQNENDRGGLVVAHDMYDVVGEIALVCSAKERK